MRANQVVLGADPGLSGGIAWLSDAVNDVVDMPIEGEGKYRVVDAAGIDRWVEQSVSKYGYNDSSFVVVEKVHSMPGQGVVSTFKFGRAYGALLATFEVRAMKIVHVTPQRWKKDLGLTKKDKDAARILALKLFPDLASSLSRKKDHGRADALLLAAWGLEEFKAGNLDFS